MIQNGGSGKTSRPVLSAPGAGLFSTSSAEGHECLASASHHSSALLPDATPRHEYPTGDKRPSGITGKGVRSRVKKRLPAQVLEPVRWSGGVE